MKPPACQGIICLLVVIGVILICKRKHSDQDRRQNGCFTISLPDTGCLQGGIAGVAKAIKLGGSVSGLLRRRPAKSSHKIIFTCLAKRGAATAANHRLRPVSSRCARRGFPARSSTPMSPTCTLLGMPPRAMTAQFSNSNGGMTRSFSTVHGRSRTTKPRPARQSGSLSGRCKRRAGVWPGRTGMGEISRPVPTESFFMLFGFFEIHSGFAFNLSIILARFFSL